jgi:hypothetical protein
LTDCDSTTKPGSGSLTLGGLLVAEDIASTQRVHPAN